MSLKGAVFVQKKKNETVIVFKNDFEKDVFFFNSMVTYG